MRKRHWPVVSVAYMPMSQYTVVDRHVSESRFQTLNSTVYHQYKIGQTTTASTMMLNKFFNGSSDSAFLYYKATNVLFSQNIFVGSAVASLTVSDTRNSQYQCQVFDESVQMALTNAVSGLVGIKINNFNKSIVKVGSYMTSTIRVWKNDLVSLSYENAFLPGTAMTLVPNEMATVQFTKTFGVARSRSQSFNAAL